MPVCSHCQTVLHPASAHRKYCSTRCGWKAWKARQPVPVLTRACRWCETVFTPDSGKQVFCSKPCCVAAHNAAAKRIRDAARERAACSECGAEFLKRGLKLYCSAACARITRDSRDHPAQVCSGCGAGFRRRGRKCSLCPGCVASKREAERKPRPYRRVTKTPYVCRLHERPKARAFVAGDCLTCGEVFVAFAHSQARFCSPGCSRKGHRQLRQHRRRGAQGSEKVFRRKVFERDGWICRLCRKPVKPDAVVPDPKAPTIDHILPLALGGLHEYANVQTAHFICNSRKSANVSQLSFAA